MTQRRRGVITLFIRFLQRHLPGRGRRPNGRTVSRQEEPPTHTPRTGTQHTAAPCTEAPSGRPGTLRVWPMLPWPVALVILVVLHVLSVILIERLTFNNAPEVYHPAGSPAVVLREQLRRDFPGDEVLTVMFQGDDLFEPDFLRRLDQVVQKLKRDALVDKVITVTTMERISGADDSFAVEPLVDVRKLDGKRVDLLRQRVMADRFAPGTLVSRDGRHMAMVVRPVPLAESSQRLSLSLITAQAINQAGLRGHYAGEAGPVTLDVMQLESIIDDSVRFVPLTVATGLLLMAWVVGRWRPVLLGAIAMSAVVHPTLALIAWTAQPYTMASAILPSLLSAYTVVTLLHLYAGIQRAQRVSETPAAAVSMAFRETLKPGLFNVVTTAAGLISLLLVPIPPVQVFGAAGTFGVLMVFFTVYGLVPPLLRRWPGPAWPQRGSGLGLLGRLAKKVTRVSLRFPWVVIGVAVVAVVATLPLLGKLRVETDLLAFFQPEHRVNVHTRAIETALIGTTSLEVSLLASKNNAFQTLATLREVQRLQKWLEAQPEVDRAASLVEAVEEMHWAMNRERPDFRVLPPNDRLLRQYVLVYDGNDLYELVNRDFQHARVVMNLNVHGTAEIRAVIQRIDAYVRAQPIPGVVVAVGGDGRLLSDQVDLLVDGQLGSFIGAFGQIFLIMAVLWRSPMGAALCMVPNLAPLFFIFVLMGALAIRLDVATVMIASVVLGITVDDTIHLYHGFRRRLQSGASVVFAVARSFEASGRAVMATSIILISQFALFASSDFVPTANFGLMTAAGLAAGLGFELLLLPALLLLWFGRRNAKLPRRATRGRKVRDWPTGDGSGDESQFAATQLMPPPPSRGRMVAESAALAVGAVTTAATPPAPAASAAAGLHVLQCSGETCRARGASAVWKQLQFLRRGPLAGSLRLTRASCLGHCDLAPMARVYPSDVVIGPLTPSNVAEEVTGAIGRAGA